MCTAGITEAGEWVRLYPIDYRYRSRQQQFRKYQWITINLLPYGHGNDRRKESRKPLLDTMKVLGSPLDTKKKWAARREIIDRMPVYTVNQLKTLHEKDRTSLGIVRPVRIHDLIIEPADSEWKPEWQGLFDQLRLFGPPQKPLRKIPFKFSYVFECDDSSKPHHAMIEDWELGVLWLNEVARLGDEQQAAMNVKRKFFDEICQPSKDTRFFMGTVFPYNTWVVLGVFWPPHLIPPPVGDVVQAKLF
ncbi:hypothetical protein CJ255_11460 [Candidatus Viridilinea mediisalina]|uniref:Uncharacterized protein n=1 Tax=Candidatus Viridilinea mediisalina TaxID=2024553 RepID=A0A2A6RII3_9CHLR|nr:hypothetical protein CJ255_11460 [Candidatus Viridilinea mediisalina]